MILRVLFLALLAIVVSGCATQVTTLNVPNIERSNSVQVADLRPLSEKQGEIFSLSVSNDAYAIYRVADSALTPPSVRLLQHRAFEKFGNGAGPLDVKVHHLVIYRNLQAELRRGAIFAGFGGAIGAAIAGQTTTNPAGMSTSLVDGKTFESLTAETEYKRALYTEQENPGRGSVHIVYIETEIQGKKVFTRTLVPIKSDDRGESLAVALEESIRLHQSRY